MYPPYGPRYKVGDRLVVYITGAGVCPAILEVTGEPRWDPDHHDREGKRGEGDQWGVITPVRGVHAVRLDEAPDLEDIGVATAAVMRKGHIAIEDWQYAQALRLIGKVRARGSSGPGGVRSMDVPIEEGEVEGYDVSPPATIKRAKRREARLVRDFRAFLEAQGDEVSRKKCLPPRASHPLYSDLFNRTRGHLIEAKASRSRGDIRMAIGQLADYTRFVQGVTRRAVLLEAKPHPDLLALLRSQSIGAIWRVGGGFTDDAGGNFT